MYGRKLRLFAVVFTCLAIASCSCNGTVSDLVEELLSSPRYNSRIRPASDLGVPLDVYINIHVHDISSISEVNMDYSMTLYLRQIWKDERLSYTSYNRSITLNYNHFERLWTPDVFVQNQKEGVFHTITVPNRLIHLSPDGTILYSQRLTLTLFCDMILHKYPMDNQTCKIEFGSYAFTTDEIMLRWLIDTKSVEINPNIKLPHFTITNVTHMVCVEDFTSVTGIFPCVRAYFHFDRRVQAYILTTYVPSFLVVLLSWLSFWIDPESTPARISLSIITILTITTQSSGLLSSMPAGSFIRAIDVWMLTCLIFVFGAFIEYSIVNTLSRRKKKAKTIRDRSAIAGLLSSATAAATVPLQPAASTSAAALAPGDTTQRMDSNLPRNGWADESTPPVLSMSPNPSKSDTCRINIGSEECPEPGNAEPRLPLPSPQAITIAGVELRVPSLLQDWWKDIVRHDALKVENISRILFPLMFFIFNLIYWPYYLT